MENFISEPVKIVLKFPILKIMKSSSFTKVHYISPDMAVNMVGDRFEN